MFFQSRSFVQGAGRRSAALIVSVVTLVAMAYFAPGYASETVPYSFQNEGDAAQPVGGLIADTQGALYGTTESESPTLCGAVFRLSPPSSGTGPWSETVLYTFFGYPGDACYPQADLALDTQGALYGTTMGGGSSGAGTVF